MTASSQPPTHSSAASTSSSADASTDGATATTTSSSADTPISTPPASTHSAPTSPQLSSATSADVPPPGPSEAELLSLSPDERKRRAKHLKDEGNRLFLASDYDAAKAKYGEAILHDPHVAIYWSNRAACELKLEQHGLAIEDATRAVRLDASFAKAYFRRASAHLSILDPQSALPDLRKVVQLEPHNATVRQQLDATVKLLRRLQFERAIAQVQGPKTWEVVEEHLREGTGGTQVPDDYQGPRLDDGDDDDDDDGDGAGDGKPQGAAANKGTSGGASPTSDRPRRKKGRHLGKISQRFVDEMLDWFRQGKKLPLRYAWQVMLGAHREFMREPTIVEYEVGEGETIDVIGDTHGQFYDLLHLLSLTGPPSSTHALCFNGDAVDRGSWSCEVVLTILAYKWLHPRRCFFNRGNHETADMNKVYGFEGECKAKFGPGDTTFKFFTELFVALPLATLITATKPPLPSSQLPAGSSRAQREPILSPRGHKRFFVVHGGLFSRDGVTLDEIRSVDRHKVGQPGQEGLMSEMLWADPQAADGRGPSKRGVGLGFGGDVCRRWCELNGVTAVLRSHEVRQDGYSEEHDGLTVTIFSAPNYCDQSENKAAFARIDDQGTVRYTQYSHVEHPPIPPMHYARGAMGGMVM